MKLDGFLLKKILTHLLLFIKIYLAMLANLNLPIRSFTTTHAIVSQFVRKAFVTVWWHHKTNVTFICLPIFFETNASFVTGNFKFKFTVYTPSPRTQCAPMHFWSADANPDPHFQIDKKFFYLAITFHGRPLIWIAVLERYSHLKKLLSKILIKICQVSSDFSGLLLPH